MMEWNRVLEHLEDVDGPDFDDAYAALDEAEASHLPDLHRLLSRPGNFVVREAVAAPVIRLEGVSALPALLDAMRLGEEEKQDNDGLACLITELVESEAAAAAPILLAMLGDPSTRRRADAAWLLGFAGPAVPPDILLGLLAGDPSAAVRAAAAGSLSGPSDDERALDGLIHALSDTDKEVRISAASALGYTRALRAIPALKAALDDPEERVRFFANYSLERLEA